jgi:hypothetical protein
MPDVGAGRKKLCDGVRFVWRVRWRPALETKLPESLIGDCCVMGGIVRPIHGPHPSALCAAGPACGCPDSLPANQSNRVGSPISHPLRQKRKTPQSGRFAFLAERVGFEPTVRLHARLISSQVHSTTLPPLRKGACGPREADMIRARRIYDNRQEGYSAPYGGLRREPSRGAPRR